MTKQEWEDVRIAWIAESEERIEDLKVDLDYAKTAEAALYIKKQIESEEALLANNKKRLLEN